MTFSLYSSRKYREPKFSKPAPLRGIEQSFSETFILKKCSFPVFVLKEMDQIWIKSRDWFSPIFIPPDQNDMGKPLSHTLEKYFSNQKPQNEKFIYSNNYGSVVLRCEAWIYFTGIFKDVDEYEHGYLFDRTFPTPIWLRQRMTECVEKHLGLKPFDLTCSDLERFFERVIDRLDITSI